MPDIPGCAAQGRQNSKGIIYRRDKMSAVKIVAIALIIAGLFGLVYGSFSYTRETQEAKLGPLELSVKDTQTVDVPAWAGVVAVMAGGVLLLVASKKS
jgi:TRAP-type C4-dicarboxylate transport system permease small subunit